MFPEQTSTHLFLLSFLILILFSSSLPPLCSAAESDTLTLGHSIRDGQSLVSAGAVFELAFFSPGNSSFRYAGILYRNVSVQTTVWVANREAAVRDSNGSFLLRGDGSLVVIDGGGNVLWSSNSSSPGSSNSSAKLLDTGNLVIGASDGSVSWQSFDHPVDTFIPGMTLSLDRKTGKNQLFTSWKSPDDPRAGNFSLGLDPSGSAQIFIWDGPAVRWRSGQWDGQTFIGTMMRSLYLYGFKLTNDVNGGKMSFTFVPFNSTLLRFVMQWDGVENTSMLVGSPAAWEAVWVQPQNECELYATCGGNGWCSASAAPMCRCVQGFEPSSSEGWSNGNWSGGCLRRTQLGCELNGSAADGFTKLGGVKLPDHSEWASAVRDAAGCQGFCVGNCSCRAYSFVPTIGCLTWDADLIDIYQFSDGSGNELFVKIAAADLGDDKSKIWIVIVVVPVSGVMIILIMCLLIWWKCREGMKNWWKCKGREDLSRILRFSREVIPDFSIPSEIIVEDWPEAKGSELPLFSFDIIAAATSDFSESNKLGQGGFGHVYEGKLPGGELIAVKRLSINSGQGLQEFKNEIMLIAKLQHRNLVKLVGCCIEGEEKILIYEYMPNKSLDAFLFDPLKQALLDWKRRFDIIDGIARGLLYLHRDSRLRVVHRDLKASNILLDENLNPKISDFGMARIFGGEQNQDNTNRVVGTYGYMSPEYAMEGLFSVKSDVYSFGILTLEIVTGRKNNSFHHLENSPNIVGYAWPMWNEGKAMELVDPKIRSSCSSRQVMRCIHIGLLCVQDRSNDRPDMHTVLQMLGGENVILRMPKQPTFVSERGPNQTGTNSVNDLTITLPSGR